MAKRYPYDTSQRALLRPAEGAKFFEEWIEKDFEDKDLLCAEMSRLAYAEQAVVETALRGREFDFVKHLGGDSPSARAKLRGTQGFLTHRSSGGPAVLAFRGTESGKLEDLLADAEIAQTSSPHFRGRVHAGFAKLWTKARGEVRDLVASVQGDLLITGHSLGAALATLAAIEALQTPRKGIMELVTFGSPRVGDQELCDLVPAERSRRYVNCCDLIARVPPERFDRATLEALFTELAAPDGAKPLAEVGIHNGAKALSAALSFLGLQPNSHLRQRIYGDQGGTIRDGVRGPGITEEELLDDQSQARAEYIRLHPRSSLADLGARLKERLEKEEAPQTDPERPAIPRLSRSLAKLIALRKDLPVPLRDLADHAPVNYLSLFTGRS